MAAVVPAGAPLPPVQVVVSLAISDDVPVVLDTLDIVVQSTPCLEWDDMPAVAGAPAQSRVPHWKMLRAFISRCSIADNPPSLAFGFFCQRDAEVLIARFGRLDLTENPFHIFIDATLILDGVDVHSGFDTSCFGLFSL